MTLEGESTKGHSHLFSTAFLEFFREKVGWVDIVIGNPPYVEDEGMGLR